MTKTYHPLVKRLLDGELSLSDLPLELRGEGAEALRLLGAVDRAPVALSAQFEARVMTEVRRRAGSPMRRFWRGLVEPRDIELRLRLRPGIVWGAGLAAAAALALLLTRPSHAPEGARPVRPRPRGDRGVGRRPGPPGGAARSEGDRRRCEGQAGRPGDRCSTGAFRPARRRRGRTAFGGRARGRRRGGGRGLRPRRRTRRQAGAAAGACEPRAVRRGADVARGGDPCGAGRPPKDHGRLGRGRDQRRAPTERAARPSRRGPGGCRSRRDTDAGGAGPRPRGGARTARPAGGRGPARAAEAPEPPQALKLRAGSIESTRRARFDPARAGPLPPAPLPRPSAQGRFHSLCPSPTISVSRPLVPIAS